MFQFSFPIFPKFELKKAIGYRLVVAIKAENISQNNFDEC